jgi:hypothetical protein
MQNHLLKILRLVCRAYALLSIGYTPEMSSKQAKYQNRNSRLLAHARLGVWSML